MKVYESLSLGQLIGKLVELGDADVRGLNGEVDSYRGYYERNATPPYDGTHAAKAIAMLYLDEVGKEITGYKGGDYTVRAGEQIYYAGWGDCGPAICGLQKCEDGVYEPVLVNENW